MQKNGRNLLILILTFVVAFSFIIPLQADTEALDNNFVSLHNCYDDCNDVLTQSVAGYPSIGEDVTAYGLINSFNQRRAEFDELYEMFGDIDISFWADKHIGEHTLENLQNQIEQNLQQMIYQIQHLQQLGLPEFEDADATMIAQMSACWPNCNPSNLVRRVISSAPTTDPGRCWAVIQHVAYECGICSRNFGDSYEIIGDSHVWWSASNCNTLCLFCGFNAGSQCVWTSISACQDRCTRCSAIRGSCDWVFEGNRQRCRRCGDIIWLGRSFDEDEWEFDE
ncbi:MAG: hypothetical protein FWE33_00720 [Defluviitaleaceae bacterium]|nr:hypothetical protein [Defluviitaleaceae bacterium]